MFFVTRRVFVDGAYRAETRYLDALGRWVAAPGLARAYLTESRAFDAAVHSDANGYGFEVIELDDGDVDQLDNEALLYSVAMGA